MKKFFSILIAFLFATGSVFCAGVPGWLKNPEKEFPESSYIMAEGEGNSLNVAKNSALAGISLHFDTKIDYVALISSFAKLLVTTKTGSRQEPKSSTKTKVLATRNPRLCVIGIWTRFARPHKADFVPNLAYACFCFYRKDAKLEITPLKAKLQFCR